MCVFWPPFVHAWYLSFWPDPALPGAQSVSPSLTTNGCRRWGHQRYRQGGAGAACWCLTLVLVVSEMVVDKVHKVEEVVTKSGRTGICIRFWCRNNPSFRLNGLVQFRFNCASDNVFTHVHTVLTKLPPRSINHHFCNMQYMWKGGTLTGARRLHYVQYTV